MGYCFHSDLAQHVNEDQKTRRQSQYDGLCYLYMIFYCGKTLYGESLLLPIQGPV